MKILQFRGKYPNFGDELNTWMWPKLLPNFFDEDESTVFIGIGSTIGDAPANAARKIVFGSGYVPQYHAVPDLRQGEWEVRFVRGPRTAKRLGLAPQKAISDSGALLRTQVNLARKTGTRICFMPHWESMERGNWEAVCRLAGIHLIDPRRPVVKVIEELLQAKLVIAEAMHGAIIADAFRIPWVPLLPLNAVHRDKWYDWAESLELKLQPQQLWPSTLNELSIKAMLAKPAPEAVVEMKPTVHERLADPQAMLAAVSPEGAPSFASRMKRKVEASPMKQKVDEGLAEIAAYRLRKLVQAPAMLSADAKINEVTERMLEQVETLRRSYAPETRWASGRVLAAG